MESRIEVITLELEEPVSEIPDAPVERIREVALQKAKDLEEILLGSPEDAKLALRKPHPEPLVLKPIETLTGLYFRLAARWICFRAFQV